ncbi:hypothetical protein HLRTI_001989 [Halorhabdus tiamatea SARL4B]|uniref:Uncharacterized protein n=1 Tax=Halorhabdus tiamatea SARL4B TaxID=1033806 RepID=F7PKM0_9EURY|nr:hypothetical protein [Halorhabdus tiamatea]ERJ05961.1 hypothetical protein HLRTI_001989 [Halorhabdus tiamatea SARL4B]CCQ34005.1 conserved hypothetical protein [Halorhabdus tiamatea SARL4B]
MVEIRAVNSAREDASGVQMVLLAVWYWMASHIALTVAIFGALMMVIGATVLQGVNNVFAGMFGVWGFSFILLGLFFDIVLRLIAAWQKRQASSSI